MLEKMKEKMREIGEILQSWSEGQKPTSVEMQQLLAEELKDRARMKAFGIEEANIQAEIEERAQLFLQIHAQIQQLCQSFGFTSADYILYRLWTLWLPLARQLAREKEKLNRTLIQGILGGQGTGKTTLAAVTRTILAHLGFTSVAISIDDLYKTYEARQKLQQEDPRLIWRGPPGTHDVDLGIEVLDQFLQPNRVEPILVPRFDKSAFNGAGDRTEPEKTSPVDIVLFEGWFVGTRPVETSVFDTLLHPINTAEDKLFARDSNERLKAYLPLWSKLDRLIVLCPVDYHLSQQWRKEAEQKMIATGKSGMSNEEIEQFVEYFWKSLHPELFIKPLISNADWANIVIEINADRSCGRVYTPGYCIE